MLPFRVVQKLNIDIIIFFLNEETFGLIVSILTKERRDFTQTFTVTFLGLNELI